MKVLQEKMSPSQCKIIVVGIGRRARAPANIDIQSHQREEALFKYLAAVECPCGDIRPLILCRLIQIFCIVIFNTVILLPNDM